MAKPQPALPKTLSHDAAKALLTRHGWTPTIGGKHSTKMVKEGQRPITLPRKQGQDYGSGLKAAILRQAGIKGPHQGGTEGREESVTESEVNQQATEER